MAQAKRDDNYIPTLLGVSNVDGETPVVLYADPTTHRLLVSLSSSIDDLSDVTITSAAQGDILYHNGSAWVNLSAGTSGQVLQTQGAGANPQWAAAGAGDVTSASTFGTDNVIIRADGTGKGVQSTGITIEDDDSIEGIGAIQFAQQSANPATTAAQSIYIDDGSNYDAGTMVLGTSSTPLLIPGNLVIDGDGTEQNSITVAGAAYDSPFMVQDVGTNYNATVNIHKHSTTAPPVIAFSRSNTDDTSHAVLTDGQDIGSLFYLGHDGTDYNQAAELRVEVDGTPGANDMPGRFVFLVSPDGSNVPAEAMRISQDKSVSFAGLTASELVATDASKNLQSLAVATYPSLTELSYVKGVTSAIQTQLNAKQGTLTNSAGLAAALSDETGTGSAVFATSPTLVTPVLGTPTSGTLTNCTGLPLTGLVDDTTTALGVGSIELGHASDTTLARVSAGVVSIEGVNIVTTSSTDTLTNKTLTAPKIADAGFIADANGNEQIVFQTTASAVNEIEVTNAATTNAPQIAATGGDTNIDLVLAAKGTGIVKGHIRRFAVRLKDSTTALATGTTIGGDYRISANAITVVGVGAYVDTAAATGTALLTIDINEAGTTIMTTNKITIDVGEKTSTTAATAAAVTDTAIAADAIITFDIDQVNETTPATGLVVWIDYVDA